MDALRLIQILTYAGTLWLGLYLLARDPRKPGLRFAGLGVVAYALGLALDALGAAADAASPLARWRWPLLFLPALLWVGATIYLLPETRLSRWASRALLPLAGSLSLLGLAANAPASGLVPWLFGLAALLPLALAVLLVLRAARSHLPRRPLVVLATAALFFGLGLGLLLLPLNRPAPEITWLAVAVDFALLGYAIAALDAYDEGETLLPDALRSLGFSAFAALLFGGQVTLALALAGPSLPLLALLLGTSGAAIALQTFADPIQAGLDRLVLARFPRLRRARADLRAVASALPRMNETLALDSLPENEFVRLTRRALSHLGDLQRLAASPLNHLPVVEARLARRGEQGNTLERAAELRAVLVESIARLKPRGPSPFGTADEWRYYNALYFPYVLGLKPYSQRTEPDGLDPAAGAAWGWFRDTVPERTLHNWQNAAARLVARDLRERVHAVENGQLAGNGSVSGRVGSGRSRRVEPS